MRWVVVLGFILVICSSVFGLLALQQKEQKKELLKHITSFEECEKAEGSMVQESYPPTCVTADKRSFVQDIGNELEYTDSILVDNPRPNQHITSPLQLTGKARGSWFFEASFSAKLYDGNGKLLSTAEVSAIGEWMTEEFIPFKAEMMFEKPTTAKGLLVLKNANPSDLPENSKELTMPVTFK